MSILKVNFILILFISLLGVGCAKRNKAGSTTVNSTDPGVCQDCPTTEGNSNENTNENTNVNTNQSDDSGNTIIESNELLLLPDGTGSEPAADAKQAQFKITRALSETSEDISAAVMLPSGLQGEVKLYVAVLVDNPTIPMEPTEQKNAEDDSIDTVALIGDLTLHSHKAYQDAGGNKNAIDFLLEKPYATVTDASVVQAMPLYKGDIIKPELPRRYRIFIGYTVGEDKTLHYSRDPLVLEYENVAQ